MSLTVSDKRAVVRKAEALVIHSDVTATGSFKCSRDDLNRLHEVYVRTQLACLQGIPVDCPQRDERMGWLGDAYATSEMCLYNFDMRELYRSYLEDMKTGVHPERKTVQFLCPTAEEGGTSIDWNVAYPAILMDCYARYGDVELLSHHYDTLKAHTDCYVSVCKDGFIPPCWFGDWFTTDYPDGTGRVAFEAGTDESCQNPPFLATVFYCQTLHLTAEIARITGHTADAEYYEAKRRCSVSALTAKHYNADTGIFGSGGQYLQAVALYEELIPSQDAGKVMDNLIKAFEKEDMRPIFGVMGHRVIYNLLINHGRKELAYKILTAEGYPSPLHMLSGGRTTLTESLDGGGSGCHCMFASPDAALYKLLGGIIVDRREMHLIKIAPYCPDDISYTECTQKIDEGTVGVSWKRENGRVTFDITLPIGVTADVSLENKGKKASAVYCGGTYSITL